MFSYIEHRNKRRKSEEKIRETKFREVMTIIGSAQKPKECLMYPCPFMNIDNSENMLKL